MKLLKLFLFVSLMFCVGTVSAQSVYVTDTGKKYHTSNCHYLKNSRKEITFEKALEMSYTACSVCKPYGNRNSLGVMSASKKSINDAAITKSTTSTQCTKKTKSGTRCKRMTKSDTGKCYQH